MPIIKEARIFENRISGKFYGDKEVRFVDGTEILTSEIQEFWKHNGKHYVKTLNTIYEVQYMEE